LTEVHSDAGQEIVPGALNLSPYSTDLLRLLEQTKCPGQRLEGTMSIVIHDSGQRYILQICVERINTEGERQTKMCTIIQCPQKRYLYLYLNSIGVSASN